MIRFWIYKNCVGKQIQKFRKIAFPSLSCLKADSSSAPSLYYYAMALRAGVPGLVSVLRLDCRLRRSRLVVCLAFWNYISGFKTVNCYRDFLGVDPHHKSFIGTADHRVRSIVRRLQHRSRAIMSHEYVVFKFLNIKGRCLPCWLPSLGRILSKQRHNSFTKLATLVSSSARCFRNCPGSWSVSP